MTDLQDATILCFDAATLLKLCYGKPGEEGITHLGLLKLLAKGHKFTRDGVKVNVPEHPPIIDGIAISDVDYFLLSDHLDFLAPQEAHVTRQPHQPAMARYIDPIRLHLQRWFAEFYEAPQREETMPYPHHKVTIVRTATGDRLREDAARYFLDVEPPASDMEGRGEFDLFLLYLQKAYAQKYAFQEEGDFGPREITDLFTGLRDEAFAEMILTLNASRVLYVTDVIQKHGVVSKTLSEPEALEEKLGVTGLVEGKMVSGCTLPVFLRYMEELELIPNWQLGNTAEEMLDRIIMRHAATTGCVPDSAKAWLYEQLVHGTPFHAVINPVDANGERQGVVLTRDEALVEQAFAQRFQLAVMERDEAAAALRSA